jgi:O-antigen/teichoic acid export membrane protein
VSIEEQDRRMNTARQDLRAASMRLLRRRLLSGGAWAFGGRILVALIGLISSALLARLLTPQDLGTYFLAYSILSVGTTLGALGLIDTVVRLVAEGMGLNLFGRVKRVINVVFGVGTLGALGAGLAYLLFGDDVAKTVFSAPALAAITGLLAGWIMVGTLQGLLGETFRGFHDIRLATLLGGQTTGGATTGVATVTLLTASLFLLWLVNGQATLATVVLLAICSGAVNTLVAGWLLHRRVTRLPPQTPDEGRKPNKKVLREVLSISLPMLIVGLVMMVRTNGDVWILGAFLPQGELALYGAASRLVNIVTMPLAIVSAIAPPLIAEMYSQGRRGDLEHALRSMATLTGIPAWLASMGCIFFAGPILGLVYGDYYREGAIVLALLSVGLFASVCAGSCGIVLAYTGHQKTLMVITIASSTATLIAMLATVEPYGIVGVATSRMVGQVIQNGIVLLVVKQKTGMWTHVGFRGIRRPWEITR